MELATLIILIFNTLVILNLLYSTIKNARELKRKRKEKKAVKKDTKATEKINKIAAERFYEANPEILDHIKE